MPVAILKQINKHNEDGSYTYGYESADGSFKIETKLPNGEVKGKYGYVDDTGKVRTIEYGATKYGFAPSGEGITVPPPTLVDETTDRNGLANQDYQQNNYYQPQEQQPIRAAPRPRPRPQPVYEPFEAPQFAPAPQRHSAAPVPSRAQIPGAVQTTNLEFGQPQRPANVRSFAPQPAPRPASNANQFSFPDFDSNPPVRSAPKVTYAQPAPLPSQYVPASRPAPRYQPGPPPAPVAAPSRPVPSSVGGRSGGILDQLSRDYALPEGGAAPLHDISFGYY